MMKGARALVLAALAIAALAHAQSWKPGDKAPAFKATGTDGKTHTLASLSKDRPLLLYFIKDGCPVNHRALPFYKQVSAAYKGKVNLVGVINTNLADYKKWQAEYKTSFVSLLDPDLKMIEAYKAVASPWAILIGRDGKIIKEWPGFSKGELEEMNRAMAAAGRVKAASINFGAAPARPQYG